jgi:hypothetical protein
MQVVHREGVNNLSIPFHGKNVPCFHAGRFISLKQLAALFLSFHKAGRPQESNLTEQLGAGATLAVEAGLLRPSDWGDKRRWFVCRSTEICNVRNSNAGGGPVNVI